MGKLRNSIFLLNTEFFTTWFDEWETNEWAKFNFMTLYHSTGWKYGV